ncbi:MAG: hypothetical protein APF81_17740 [Desulfosporosinus sp. BRH_c37]|nr:MAG: hypothetical protein APF81_17740 [Desulfosporosinus sp. BRH_c37]
MGKILTTITLSLALICLSIVPTFASEQQPTLAAVNTTVFADQTYTEWDSKKDVPESKVWSIVFNSPISASTITYQNIYVVDSNGQKQDVTVRLAADSKTIQVTPSKNYKSGETYILYILKDVASASSQTALKSNIRMNFIVGTAVTVKSINASNVTTIAGKTPVLPSTVTVTMSDGTTKTVNVTWVTPTASKYASAGTFTVSGTIAESTTIKAMATVTVTAPITPVSVSNINKTINQGDSYSLPSTVEATMSDNSKKQVPVTWNPSTVDTSKAGTYTFSGSVDGYSGKVVLTLTIVAVTVSPSYLELNRDYKAHDGLTITIKEIVKTELVSSTKTTISYSLKNETIDQKINEGCFVVHFSDGSSTNQGGFFGSLFPSESINRTYTFQELNTKTATYIEYVGDYWSYLFGPKPENGTLKWQVI